MSVNPGGQLVWRVRNIFPRSNTAGPVYDSVSLDRSGQGNISIRSAAPASASAAPIRYSYSDDVCMYIMYVI